MAKDENETTTIDNKEALQKIADTATQVADETSVQPQPTIKVTVEKTIQPQPIVKVENTEVVAKTETIIVFRANRPLMDHEYAELEKRIRFENEKSGLKIVLAPHVVDVEITGS